MLDCLLQCASICSFQPPLRFVGKSWSFDCFSGFISLVITQFRASPRGDGQKAFYRLIKLIVVFVILFLT